MIRLQRELAIIVKKEVYEKGNAPKHISQGQAYPVIGYSVQLRERPKKGGFQDETVKQEEISVFLVVNNDKQIGYVYPSLCEIYIDPFRSPIVDSSFITGKKPDEKTS